MIKLKIIWIFFCCVILFSTSSLYAQDNLQLWYRQPAVKWTDALPIGNGRLGAMIFGTVETDRLQFNEETVWTGGPRNYHRDSAYRYLPKIRQLLFEGKQAEAEKLAGEQFMGLQSDEGKRDQWFKEMRSLKGLKGDPALPTFNDTDWKLINVPSYEGWETTGLEGLDGAVWFRTSFIAPKEWEGKNLILDLNRIRDQDFTYVNGKLVGSMNTTDPRKYVVSKNVWKPGENIIAIQVLNYFDKGGIAGYKDTTRHIRIYPENDSSFSELSLQKKWKYKIQNHEPPAVPRFQADYQPFGDLNITFSNHAGFSNYKRELDISNAIAKTTYSAGGVSYTREYFSSAPDNLIVIRLQADKKGSISFVADLTSPHKNASTRKINGNTFGLSLKVRNGVLKGECSKRRSR